MPIHHLPYENGLAVIRGGGNLPRVATRLDFCDSGGSWEEVYRVDRCVSRNIVAGTWNWEQFIVTNKYAPTLQPISPTFTVQPYAPARNRIIFNWTDPTGYIGYGMALSWMNYDAQARGDFSFDGSDFLPYGRGTTYTAGSVGDPGDHVSVVMYYQDTDGYQALQYTAIVPL